MEDRKRLNWKVTALEFSDMIPDVVIRNDGTGLHAGQ